MEGIKPGNKFLETFIVEYEKTKNKKDFVSGLDKKIIFSKLVPYLINPTSLNGAFKAMASSNFEKEKTDYEINKAKINKNNIKALIDYKSFANLYKKATLDLLKEEISSSTNFEEFTKKLVKIQKELNEEIELYFNIIYSEFSYKA